MNASYVLYASYIGTACVAFLGIGTLVVFIAAALSKTQRKRFEDDAQDPDGIVRFWDCLRPFVVPAFPLFVMSLFCDANGPDGLQIISTALKAAWCEMLALGITAYALVEFRYRKLKRAAKC